MGFMKKLIIALLSLFILIIGYFVFFFNLNDFKKPIEAQVYQMTGRDLHIIGNIDWSIYPSIGLDINNVTFSNPKNLTPANFVDIKKLSLQVALMPLLSKDLQVAGINIDGVTINWVNGNKGENSLSSIGKSPSDSQPTAPKSDNAPETASKEPIHNNINGLNIDIVTLSNITFNLYENKTLTNSLTLDSLTLKQFILGQNSPFAFQINTMANGNNLLLKGHGQINLAAKFDQVSLLHTQIESVITGKSLPVSPINTVIHLNADAQLQQKKVDLKLTKLSVNDIQGKGEVTANYGKSIPVINAHFDFGNIDLTPWVPQAKNKTSKPNTADVTNNVGTVKNKDVKTAQKEPDLSFLNTINAQIKLNIDTLQYQKIKTQHWVLNATIHNGIASVNPLTANLYDGSIRFSGQLFQRNHKSAYHFEQTVSQVKIKPLLSDSANMKLLSGTANFNVKGGGSTLIASKIISNLKADGQFSVKNGSLYGINIPQQIRVIKAKFTGEQAPTSTDKKTDFTNLTGSFTLENGIFENSNLNLDAPVIDIKGQGNANLVKQSLDYNLAIKIHEKNNPLKGIDIPLIISGPLDAPRFTIDTDSLFKEKAKKELKRAEKKLEKKLKDKLFEKLGLFN